MALENPIPESHFPSPSPSTCSPIRTRFAKHLDPPQSTTSKEALRKMAKEMMELPYRQPYHIKTRARYTERVLPVVSGSLRLKGIDGEEDDKSFPSFELDDMLWDTGAQGCVITEDQIPEKFRQELQKPEHDPYRSADGTKIQVDGYMLFSNTGFKFNCIFTVVPLTAVPNHRSGVILGQSGLIDRMVLSQVPRMILKCSGEDIEDHEWGDIIIKKWLDIDGVVHEL